MVKHVEVLRLPIVDHAAVVTDPELVPQLNT
jgi:hypothetical protein